MDVLLKKYFWMVNLIVVGLCAGLGGAAAAHLVEQSWLLGVEETRHALRAERPRAAPPQAEKVHHKDDKVIVERNVFCSQCKPEPAKADRDDPKNREILKSTLPLELVATMWVDDDSRWSMAVIRDTASREKDARMYNAGTLIEGTQVAVLRVDPKKVYIRSEGRIEYLEIEGAAVEKKGASVAPEPVVAGAGVDPMDAEVQRGVRCSGSNCDVDRGLLDKLLSNTTALATSARFVPSMKDGRPNGFKLYAIRPGSIFGKIGVQNGDTIKAINGMEMSSPDQALAVYSKLRTASHLTVSVERRGETVTLDYTIR